MSTRDHLDDDDRHRVAAAPVARLATVRPGGRPHLVVITFAVTGPDEIVTAIDHKPKSTTSLQRLRNLAADPRVSVLVDHYDDDWSRLWWVRADGRARVDDAADRRTAIDALVAKYPPYREHRPEGPVITVTVERWSTWSATGAGSG